MPAKSEKQEKFMRAVAHSPSFAKKVGVPMSVGREFTKKESSMPIVPKMETESESRSKQSDYQKKRSVSGAAQSEAMKKGGKVKKMAMGGYAGGGMPMGPDGKPTFVGDGKGKMKKGGMAMKKMASGGLAAGHKSADGVASKGKTKAKQVTMGGSTGMKKGGMTKMKYGGKAC